jgi:hypothetical protein
VTPERKYVTGLALRTALEERLKRLAREEGVDLQRLRRQVAFDRFLARLFPGAGADWILKGGYAMELRFQTARATRDLDFTVRVAESGRGDGLLKQLQDAGAKDAGDFFYYRIGEAMMDLDGAPHGGARYPVESTMGGVPLSNSTWMSELVTSFLIRRNKPGCATGLVSQVSLHRTFP